MHAVHNRVKVIVIWVVVMVVVVVIVWEIVVDPMHVLVDVSLIVLGWPLYKK
jgi:hypothetical protein